ncbi:MAG: peptide deformylase [Planctomycetia bacterium]|nr:peptide deformylase [Planctomycetia bacterium]
MSLEIVKYPHPVLSHVARPLRRVDDELRSIVREMFDLMYATRGIGLAAVQVGLPYRLIVINPSGNAEEKDQERALINPVLSRPKGNEEMDEGCLSLPDIWAPVRRAKEITLSAWTPDGEEVSLRAKGMLARVLQHECDHLDGMLFVDRVAAAARMEIEDALEEMAIEYRQNVKMGRYPDDETVAARISELEALRC